MGGRTRSPGKIASMDSSMNRLRWSPLQGRSSSIGSAMTLTSLLANTGYYVLSFEPGKGRPTDARSENLWG